MLKTLFVLKKQIIFILINLPIYIYFYFPGIMSDYLLGLLFVLSIATNFFISGRMIELSSNLKYRVNSSLDRPLTKICLGGLLWSLMLSFESPNISVILLIIANNIFFTYPTSNRVKRNDVIYHLSEFKFLDRFEKVLLFLTGFFLFVSAYRSEIFWPDIFNRVHPYFLNFTK